MRKYLAQLSVALCVGAMLAAPAFLENAKSKPPSDGLNLTAILEPRHRAARRPTAKPKPAFGTKRLHKAH